MTTDAPGRSLSVPFLVITPDTIIQKLLDALPKDRIQRQKYYVVYEAGAGYTVLRWCDLEILASPGPADRSKPLSSLHGLPTTPNAAVNPPDLSTHDFRAPVVVSVAGSVVAVLADDSWAAPGPPKDPFVKLGGVLGGVGRTPVPDPTAGDGPEDAPAADREVNAWVDGYDSTAPLGVGNVYRLLFDVAPKRKDRLLVPPESAVKASKLFAPGVKEVTLSITIDGGSDFKVWGSDQQLLVVPRNSNSKGVAGFNIEPLHTGESRLDAYIFLGDNLLQQWTFTFQAGPFVAGQPIVEVKAKGSALGEGTGKLNQQRSVNSVNIVINSLNQGYTSLVINGVRASAKLGLTAEAADQLLGEARKALYDIVHTDEFNTRPYLAGIDIPADVHQATLNKLAEVGTLLYEQLFYGPGTDDSTAKIGDLLRNYSNSRGQLRIQIAAENFIFPWTLLYDGEPGVDADWEHFWGFRHVVEYIPNAPATLSNFDPEIMVDGKLPLTFVSNLAIDEQMGIPLIADQQTFFGTKSDLITLTQRTKKAEVLEDFKNPNLAAQVIYFYCHAESMLPGDGQSTLKSVLLIDDLNDANGLTVQEMTIKAGFRNKFTSAPLVYINACQGAEMSAKLYAGLVPYLVQKGVRGVIGTEVDTPALFASTFAQRFFTRFLEGDTALGPLMRELRREFVTQHNNVMGLVYALYSNGEVRLVRGG